jgi:hypothetical protein
VALGLLIVGFYLAVYLDSSGTVNIGTGFAKPAAIYAQRLSANPTYFDVVPIAASAILVALCILVNSSSRFGVPLRRTIHVLAYGGISSMLLYFASSRFLPLAGAPIPGRYSAILVIAALLGAILCCSTLMPRWRVSVVAAFVLGAAGLWFVRHPSLLLDWDPTAWLERHRPASWTPTARLFAFARAADGFRKTCEDGEAIAESPSRRASYTFFISCRKIVVDDKAIIRDTSPIPGYDADYVAVPDVRAWNTGEKVSAVLYALKPFP